MKLSPFGRWDPSVSVYVPVKIISGRKGRELKAFLTKAYSRPAPKPPLRRWFVVSLADYGFDGEMAGFFVRGLSSAAVTDSYSRIGPQSATTHKTRGQVCGPNAVLLDTAELLVDDAVLGGSGKLEDLSKVLGIAFSD